MSCRSSLRSANKTTTNAKSNACRTRPDAAGAPSGGFVVRLCGGLNLGECPRGHDADVHQLCGQVEGQSEVRNGALESTRDSRAGKRFECTRHRSRPTTARPPPQPIRIRQTIVPPCNKWDREAGHRGRRDANVKRVRSSRRRFVLVVSTRQGIETYSAQVLNLACTPMRQKRAGTVTSIALTDKEAGECSDRRRDRHAVWEGGSSTCPTRSTVMWPTNDARHAAWHLSATSRGRGGPSARPQDCAGGYGRRHRCRERCAHQRRRLPRHRARAHNMSR